MMLIHVLYVRGWLFPHLLVIMDHLREILGHLAGILPHFKGVRIGKAPELELAPYLKGY
jgi:hypothetical protein